MKILTLFAAACLLIAGCFNADADTGETIQNYTKDKNKNQLSFKMNGELWSADNDIFGAFHPAGYNKAVLIAGSKGPKDKNEQTFNINLYNINGPGTYEIKNGNADNCVAQLANLSSDKFLYGSMMGYDIKVTLLHCSSTNVEARFEGWLIGNSSDTLKISEGYFNYKQ